MTFFPRFPQIPYHPYKIWDRRHFRGDFPDFLNKFVEDAEIFLVVKQHTQIGRKTPGRIVNKILMWMLR